jgi:hypothetical protein
VTACTFLDNVSAYQAGAIYNCGGNGTATLTVESCRFERNSAQFGGGAIHNHASLGTATATIQRSTIRSNFVIHSQSLGGGIGNFAAPDGAANLTIKESTIEDNQAEGGGGAIFSICDGNSALASVAIADTTISGNSGGSNGGGLLSYGRSAGSAVLTIVNSTFSNNRAETARNLNIGTLWGGSSSATIGNSIFTTETPSDHPWGNIYRSEGTTVTSAGYNLCDDACHSVFIAAGDQINTDAMLGPLQENGGPTRTHAPLINSPAVDRGKRNTIPALATNLDQRGWPRPVDDPAVPNMTGGDGSDVGAVENGVGVHPAGAASQKTHGIAGTFAIELPLTGTAGVECRSGSPSGEHKVVVTFAQPVVFSHAAVVRGNGEVASTTSSGNEVTLHLTGIADAQVLTLALFGVTDGTNSGDLGVRLGLLSGDINGSRTVNATDISIVKSGSGAVVTGANFRSDINANGLITASDIAQVKANAGRALP